MNLVVFQLVLSSDSEGNRIFNNHSFYLYLDEDSVRIETDFIPNVNSQNNDLDKQDCFDAAAPLILSADPSDQSNQNLICKALSERNSHKTDTFSVYGIVRLTVD